jgi:tetratricopeptide (TPR) repeat protein
MPSMISRLARTIAIAALCLMGVCLTAVSHSALTAEPETGLPRPALLPGNPEAEQATLDWLERRVQRDPEDIMALNMLGNRYLQRMRETGNATYVQLAAKAARSSLASVAAEHNSGALNLLTQVEFATHDFAAARDHARSLAQLAPEEAYPYQILGDALLELGDYDQAVAVFRRMKQSDNSEPLIRIGTEQRLARLDALHGDWDSARRRLVLALNLALSRPKPPRETVAWSWWQLGEIAFAVGDYPNAEQYDRAALITFPGYFRATASLGRVRAARGDLAGAIANYEAAVRILPDPTFLAALGDLYTIAKRPSDAAKQYQLVEAIARLGAAGGSIYDRQLALFYADHDLKPELAYALAKKEYGLRRDIYGADALAWTAFKADHLAEAQMEIKEALRLGTRDAKLFYHAAMISRSAADRAAAHRYLDQAMALNPRFDPLQDAIARSIQAQEFSSRAGTARR